MMHSIDTAQHGSGLSKLAYGLAKHVLCAQRLPDTSGQRLQHLTRKARHGATGV